MSLLDSIFGTHLPHYRPDQWVSSYAPTIGLIQDGKTQWFVVHNIPEVIEEEGKLTIKMTSGNAYTFTHPDTIKAVREELVKAKILR